MKKLQAIMEFLMAYGWAILIALAAISILLFFKALPPGNRCICNPSGNYFENYTYKIKCISTELYIQYAKPLAKIL